MKNLNILLSIVMVAVVLLSSCSKPKYTASFSPSKSVRYTKIEKPVISKEAIVESKEAITTSKTPINVPVVKKELVKPTTLNNTVTESTFNKVELKQMKKEVRKTIFKQVKNNIFHKKTAVKANDKQLISVILAILLPPVGVWYYQDSITNDFWLDLVLLLTIVGSVIYALLVVLDVVSIA